MESNNVIKINENAGVRLKRRYLESQDKEKIDKYTVEANKILDDFEKEIESFIDNGKAPISIRNTAKSNSGILVNNMELENMVKDFLFNVILTDEADKRGLKIDIQATPVGLDSKTRQPIVGICIACTFK